MEDTKDILEKIQKWMDINESRVGIFSFRRPNFKNPICQHKWFKPVVLTLAFKHKNNRFIKYWDEQFSCSEDFYAYRELIEHRSMTSCTIPTLRYYLYLNGLGIDDDLSISKLDLLASVYPCTSMSDVIKCVFTKDEQGQVKIQMYTSTQREVTPRYISNTRSRANPESFSLKNAHTKIFYMLNTEDAVFGFSQLLLNPVFKQEDVMKFLSSYQSGMFKETLSRTDFVGIKALLASKATGMELKKAEIMLQMIRNQPFDSYLEAVKNGMDTVYIDSVEIPTL